MAIITTISGVPLFTTVQEALSWADGNNCSGYHSHAYEGQMGYMGCTSHTQASGAPLPPPESPPQSLQINIPTVSPSSSSSSSGGGGGGGGGY